MRRFRGRTPSPWAWPRRQTPGCWRFRRCGGPEERQRDAELLRPDAGAPHRRCSDRTQIQHTSGRPNLHLRLSIHERPIFRWCPPRTTLTVRFTQGRALVSSVDPLIACEDAMREPRPSRGLGRDRLLKVKVVRLVPCVDPIAGTKMTVVLRSDRNRARAQPLSPFRFRSRTATSMVAFVALSSPSASDPASPTTTAPAFRSIATRSSRMTGSSRRKNTHPASKTSSFSVPACSRPAPVAIAACRPAWRGTRITHRNPSRS